MDGNLHWVRRLVLRGILAPGVCETVGTELTSHLCHPPGASQTSKDLSTKIVEVAQARRRFGYRRIHDMLRGDFPGVTHKRVYRLYSEASLAVCRRKKARRSATVRVPLQVAQMLSIRNTAALGGCLD